MPLNIPKQQVMIKNASDQAIPLVGANSIGSPTSMLYGDGTNISNIPTAGTAETISEQAKKGSVGTITAGKAVYLTGYNVGGWHEVEEAKADSASTLPAYGVTSTSVTNSTAGTIVKIGHVEGIDTDSPEGAGWAVNDAIYVSEINSGALTNVKPTGSDFVQKVALVERVHSSQGILAVVGAGRTNDVPNDVVIVNSFVTKTNAGVPSASGTEGQIVWDSTNDNLYVNSDGSTTWDLIGGAGSATQLTDLTDVNTATATDGNLLVADGTDWESVTQDGAGLLNKTGDQTGITGNKTMTGILNVAGGTIVVETNAGVPSGANTEGTIVMDTTNEDLYLGTGSTTWQKIGGGSASSGLQIAEGWYGGSAGASQDITGLGFDPSFVMIFGDSNQDWVWASTATMTSTSAGKTRQWGAGTVQENNNSILPITDGFRVYDGSSLPDDDDNNYYWVAFG